MEKIMKIEIINENNKKIKNIGIFMDCFSTYDDKSCYRSWLVVDYNISCFSLLRLLQAIIAIYWASLYFL